jgi:hypothetical protein
MQLFQFIRLLLLFRSKMKLQKHFVLKLLQPLCTELTENDKQRFYKYGLYVPLFIGESFALLRGNKLAEKERIAITFLGCMTGLFDDLFDENNYSDSFIRKVLENPIKDLAHSPQIAILVEVYHLFLDHTPQKSNAKTLMLQVFEAQAASRLQTEKTLTPTELETITYNKGGLSMQLYRRAFMEDISESEDILFYKLGAIGQLENDIFDVFKDYRAGINTLATKAIDIRQLESVYRNLHSEIWNSIDNIHFKSPDKENFKRICSLIIARGYVAIHQLKNVSKKTNGIFKPAEYSRKDLICDMEKPLNRVKLLYYAASCIKK